MQHEQNLRHTAASPLSFERGSSSRRSSQGHLKGSGEPNIMKPVAGDIFQQTQAARNSPILRSSSSKFIRTPTDGSLQIKAVDRALQSKVAGDRRDSTDMVTWNNNNCRSVVQDDDVVTSNDDANIEVSKVSMYLIVYIFVVTSLMYIQYLGAVSFSCRVYLCIYSDFP